MELYCKNCDHRLEESDNYCPNCGQKTDEELTIKTLFNNTISNYFSVDARFFVSFLPLLFRPGYLPTKFVEGKRLKYLHPAQFYLFISVVFFFLLSIESRKQQEALDKGILRNMEVKIDTAAIRELDSVNKALAKEKVFNLQSEVIGDSLPDGQKETQVVQIGLGQTVLDSLIEADAPEIEKLQALGYREQSASWKKVIYRQALKIYESRGGGILEAFYDTIPIAMFFLLPVFGLLLKLLFLKKGKFAHHLVFSFYYFSFLFTVFTFYLLANMIGDIPYWINWAILLSTPLYLVFAIKKFYGTGYLKAIFKTALLGLMYLIFIIPTSFFILAGVTFLLY